MRAARGPLVRLLVVVVVASLAAATAQLPPGTPAPDFALVTPDGRLVAPSHSPGTALVVNFWAPWCVPCRTEMPRFAEVARTAETHDLAVRFLLVNVDGDLERGAAFLEELIGPLPAPMLPLYAPDRERRAELRDDGFDATTAQQVVRRYRVFGYPTTVAIAPDGTVAAAREGELDRGELHELLAAAGVTLP